MPARIVSATDSLCGRPREVPWSVLLREMNIRQTLTSTARLPYPGDVKQPLTIWGGSDAAAK
jgi:hypothetical protein